MIEELQITQNNNSIYPSTYFYWSAFTPLIDNSNNITKELRGYYGYSGIPNQQYGFLTGYMQGTATVIVGASPDVIQNGIYLVTSNNESGSIYWEMPTFDYTKNFEVIANGLQGRGNGTGYTDQISIGVACASVPDVSGGTRQYSVGGQTGLWAGWDSTNVESFLYANQISLAPVRPLSFQLAFSNTVAQIKLNVISVGGSRIASLYFNGVFQNSAIITYANWNAGKFLVIAASSVGNNTPFTCNSVQLNYIY
jgi:hypothetical protein